MAFGKKTDRAGLQAVLELKNVDYSKDLLHILFHGT